MAGRSWDEIPQSEWRDITLHVHDDGGWSVRFDYIGANNQRYQYPEEEITYDDFLSIYDEAGTLDQTLTIESDT